MISYLLGFTVGTTLALLISIARQRTEPAQRLVAALVTATAATCLALAVALPPILRSMKDLLP